MLSYLHWKAALWAGLMAGAVFVILEMLLVGTVGGDSPWAPPRMIAAIAMGPGVLPPPATFDMGHHSDRNGHPFRLGHNLRLHSRLGHLALSPRTCGCGDGRACVRHRRLHRELLWLYRVLPLVRDGAQLDKPLVPRGVRIGPRRGLSHVGETRCRGGTQRHGSLRRAVAAVRVTNTP